VGGQDRFNALLTGRYNLIEIHHEQRHCALLVSFVLAASDSCVIVIGV
jgi:hypothetical protein